MEKFFLANVDGPNVDSLGEKCLDISLVEVNLGSTVLSYLLF